MATKTKKEKTASSPYAPPGSKPTIRGSSNSKVPTTNSQNKPDNKTKTSTSTKTKETVKANAKVSPAVKASSSQKNASKAPSVSKSKSTASSQSVKTDLKTSKTSEIQSTRSKKSVDIPNATKKNSVEIPKEIKTKKSSPDSSVVPGNSSQLTKSSTKPNSVTKPEETKTTTDNKKVPSDQSTTVATPPPAQLTSVASAADERKPAKENPLNEPVIPEPSYEDYEDDFESYESDFESASDASTPSSYSRSLGNVSEWNPSTDDEEDEIEERKTTQEPPDAQYAAWKRDLQRPRTPVVDSAPPASKSLIKNEEDKDVKPFALDFASAKKRQQQKQIQSRAATLLSMIRLDILHFQLVQWSPAPYDIYMKTFGRRDTRQVAVETGEGTQEFEIQTDSPSNVAKWTQHPPTFNPRNIPENDWHSLAQERLGVGTLETNEQESEVLWKGNAYSPRLQKFLEAAGEVVLSLLAEKAVTSYPSAIPDGNQGRKMLANVGHVTVDVQTVDLMKQRVVTHVKYAPHHAHWLLTVLSPHSDEEDSQDLLCDRWLLCLWNTKQLAVPHKIFSTFGEVSCLDWGPGDQILAAGLTDGTLCCWNLHEPSSHHPTVVEGNSSYVIRTPTYIARSESISSTLVGVACLFDSSQTTSAFQVYTLDDGGRLSAWAVLSVTDSTLRGEADIGLSPWGSTALVALSSHDLNHKLTTPHLSESMFFCMQKTFGETSMLLLGGEAGVILEWSVTADKLRTCYYPPSDREMGSIISISTCAKLPQHFLAGSSTGLVALYRRPCPTPVLYWRLDSSTLKSVSWLPWRPELFLAWVDSHKIVLFNISNESTRAMEELPMDFSLTSVGVSGHNPPQLCLGSKGKFEIHTAAASGDEASVLANLIRTLGDVL